jgi:hypothetical protein
MKLCVWPSAARVTTAALILLLPLGTADESGAQSKIPIPEFYGVYLVSDGKLINLDPYEAKSNNRLKAPGMTLLSIAKMGIAPLSGLVASADSYVLMYLQGPMVPMNLGRFEYVERLTVGTGTPLEPKRTVDARMWQLKVNIPVNVGPVAGRQDLIRLVPAKPLADGVYAWYIGSLETMGIMNEVAVCDFVVGKAPQTPPNVARELPSPQPASPGSPSTQAPPAIAELSGKWVGQFIGVRDAYPFTWIVKPDGSYEVEWQYQDQPKRQETGQIRLDGGQLKWLTRGGAGGTLSLSGSGETRVLRGTFDGSTATLELRPAPSAGAGPRTGDLPPQQPARPKISDLTRGIPNTDHFPERQRTFNQGFGSVWEAAKRVLQKRDLLNANGDRISTENRDQGILITDATDHARLVGALRRQYFIVIDASSPASTQVNVKGFCYHQRGRQWTSITPPDRCSAGFLEDLEKELTKVIQGGTLSSRASSASSSDSAEQGCLGMQAQAEVEAGKKARERTISDGNYRVVSKDQKGITTTFSRLLSALGTDKSSWAWWGKYGGWELTLVDMGGQGPNAFAFPGGIVAFDVRFTNLSEDEAAFILGHEIAHAILCHGWTGIDFKAGAVNYRRLIDNAFGVGIAPAQERAADEWGFWLMNRAGFDPTKGLAFFEGSARGVSALEIWLNRHLVGTHPSSQERLVAARSTIARLRGSPNVAPPTEASGGMK